MQNLECNLWAALLFYCTRMKQVVVSFQHTLVLAICGDSYQRGRIVQDFNLRRHFDQRLNIVIHIAMTPWD